MNVCLARKLASVTDVVFFYRIDENLRLLIGDIALSRDVFPGDYHCLGDNENRPVKWLALEALTNHQFSSASDVVRLTN